MVIIHSALSRLTPAVDLPHFSQFAQTIGGRDNQKMKAATTGGRLTRPTTTKAAVAAGATIAAVAARDGGTREPQSRLIIHSLLCRKRVLESNYGPQLCLMATEGRLLNECEKRRRCVAVAVAADGAADASQSRLMDQAIDL